MGQGNILVDGVLKMNVPRILFYLQMVPISLPRSFFSTLNNVPEIYMA